MYAWREMPLSWPNARMGGGGAPGVGLWSKRGFSRGRKPSLSFISAMACRSRLDPDTQGGVDVEAKNAEVAAGLTCVKKDFGCCRGNLWGGPSGGFGPVEGLGTLCRLGMVA